MPFFRKAGLNRDWSGPSGHARARANLALIADNPAGDFPGRIFRGAPRIHARHCDRPAALRRLLSTRAQRIRAYINFSAGRKTARRSLRLYTICADRSSSSIGLRFSRGLALTSDPGAPNHVPRTLNDFFCAKLALSAETSPPGATGKYRGRARLYERRIRETARAVIYASHEPARISLF